MHGTDGICANADGMRSRDMIENFIVPKSASDSTTLQPFQCELKARRGATAQVPGAAKFFWRKVWAPAKGRVAAPQVAANKTAALVALKGAG
jgi:hypothetical protein